MKTLKCGCVYVDEFDYGPITEEGCEVGDVYAACAGHMHLKKIRTLLTTKKEHPVSEVAGKTYEQGAYDGEATQEMLARLRRFETRVTKFMRWQGFNPVSNPSAEVEGTCTVDHRGIHCSSPDVTFGQISCVANEARLNGPIDLYVGGHHWGTVNV